MDFLGGSEWRKWDLHVHAPGTKLADGYAKSGEDRDWNRFCQVIHDSDVSAIGITDYLSLDSFFEFRKHYESLYQRTIDKVFFPNHELRLPEAINDAGQSVNLHLIFRRTLRIRTHISFSWLFGPRLLLGRQENHQRYMQTSRLPLSFKAQPCPARAFTAQFDTRLVIKPSLETTC